MKIQTQVDNLEKYSIYLQVKKSVNEFLTKKGYLEIDLPVLSPALIPESYLEVFETKFNYFNTQEKLYLTPSPELFLKRLLAYQVGDCYYLGKAFRNHEKSSDLHEFEFTMLEFYKTKTDYMGISGEVLKMLQYVAKGITGKNFIYFQGKKINLSRWEKISIVQAFEKYAQINKIELFNHQQFLERAKKKGYNTKGFSYEDLWSQIYTAEIEPHLGTNGYPTLIYDYPKEFAALAKLNKDRQTAQRFEFYIAGIELGDCYTELTDWQEQDKRFLEEQKLRQKAGKINHPIDKGFVEALKYGLTDCAGIAIGFERLAMIFADVLSINKLKLINIAYED